KITFKSIEEGKPLKMGALTLNFQSTLHPSLTLCSKITTPHQTISYITDNEANVAKQTDFIAFHKNTDIFIHEMQYTREEYRVKAGWGHSSLLAVIELVAQITPKAWYVTHHDPEHTDLGLKHLADTTRDLLKQKDLSFPVRFVSDNYVLKLQ